MGLTLEASREESVPLKPLKGFKLPTVNRHDGLAGDTVQTHWLARKAEVRAVQDGNGIPRKLHFPRADAIPIRKQFTSSQPG
jgi:hypothetical protein